MGLHNALLELQQQHPEVDVTYSATAKLSRPVASAIYDAALQAVRAALSAKAERNQQHTARRLVRELKTGAPRVPGFLSRLCDWEKQQGRATVFTLRNRHD